MCRFKVGDLVSRRNYKGVYRVLEVFTKEDGGNYLIITTDGLPEPVTTHEYNVEPEDAT